jgi:hypothetical protein
MGAGIRVARRASARNVEFWQSNRCCAFLSSYGPTGELTHLDLPKPKRQTNELDRPDRPQRRTLLHICYKKRTRLVTNIEPNRNEPFDAPFVFQGLDGGT